MNELKHTPGPWTHAERGVLRGANGRRVGDLDNGEPITIGRHAEVTGDRALQEAAPELLEAHQENARILSFVISELQGRAPAEKLNALSACLGRCNAAIAKARGGER